MKQPVTDRVKNWFEERPRMPLGVRIAVYVLPAVIVVLFYILRSVRGVMDWVSSYVALPIRQFLGMLSSIYPVALMELVCTAAGIFLIYYIVKAFKDSARKREKWRVLGKRGLKLLVVFCYIYGMFCWLWSSGYHASGFAERYGLVSNGVETAELVAVTEMFAQNANELSVLLERDEDGNLIMQRSQMFAESRQIYANIAEEFPTLSGTIYAPKPMYLYSWLMTITGYSGMYFAITGEAMVNTQLHAAFMPMTVAHEHAHQLGIFAEDEANFVGILACVTSGNSVFEYAGYMSGLNYLSSALSRADYDEYTRIMSGLSNEVRLDRAQNSAFWEQSTTSDMGVAFIDNFLTSVMNASNAAVDTVYDSYLRSQSQELGIRSYGACVDLIIAYFSPMLVSPALQQR